MLEQILKFSIQHRLLVLLVALAVAVIGVLSLQKLPIDAVPDITNNQVQINTLAPSLSPAEIEKQVTFPLETALAGIPGLEYTRSLSRNGFSQVTAVFRDDVDVYGARSQIDQRLRVARAALPAGAEPNMGPVTTGLGEVYMWAVDFEHPGGRGATSAGGSPGWQPDGAYRTPEGELLTSDKQRSAYLRTVQDWIIRPQLKQVEGVADIDSLGGYEKQYVVEPDPMKLVSYGLSFPDVLNALERNNSSQGAGSIEHHGESYPVRIAGLCPVPDLCAGDGRTSHVWTGARAGKCSRRGSKSPVRAASAAGTARPMACGSGGGAAVRSVALAVWPPGAGVHSGIG